MEKCIFLVFIQQIQGGSNKTDIDFFVTIIAKHFLALLSLQSRF